ncbi:VOC family protein [Nocardioides aurantiacus]|uniref:Glyoxalase/bleomycin resistance protein/dioxygenase superfamily protein n=1 Tax=Nocardioides aurantiacus TaxID=86796 RepID=A0A3N2CYK6_9ACTN|nr:VOC family protein [Nocardioides aurantiacus]ROR92617.1 glyoxalase/bleomycin resistance protein/dioxygenase superfamily protein [Nocardioides aurantiacus]
MLDQAEVTANIPAADLARARAFYADKLGVTPVQEMAGVALLYRTGAGSVFTIYQTEHAGRAGHTIAQWHVADVPAAARELAAKGVRFDHFDAPGMEWDGDVSFTEGMGHAAWFRDSEDNVLCLDSGVPGLD